MKFAFVEELGQSLGFAVAAAENEAARLLACLPILGQYFDEMVGTFLGYQVPQLAGFADRLAASRGEVSDTEVVERRQHVFLERCLQADRSEERRVGKECG